MKAPLRPIFIVGIPKSGATWLLSLLEKHTQCRVVTPEALGIKPPRPTKKTGLFLRGLSSGEIYERFSRLPTDRVPVENSPGHLLQAGHIKRIFPDARIVLIRRQPLDVVWSMLQENTFWAESPKSLAEAVALYNEYAKAQEAYLGYDVIVDYETMWHQPVEQLSRVLIQLELDSAIAPELVAQTAKGKSLPAELSSVFRKGSPGEGTQHFSDASKAYLRSHLHIHYSSPAKKTILLTTNHLLGWTGSETLLLTLMNGLLERGYPLAVYTRHWDQVWLDKYFDPRIRLTDDLTTLHNLPFDLAHVQHNACLLEVKAAFPTLPVVFSSLGILPFFEQPPPFDLGVSHYLALSEEIRDNLVRQGIPGQAIHILRNTVSGKWFFPTGPIRERPERILVLSYKMNEGKKHLLREAVSQIGATIRFIGGEAESIPNSQLGAFINEADIVVSLGRGVIEAMLCGRVPLVYDIQGGDGLVTPENIHELCACNFSGRLYRQEYSIDTLVAEFGKYRQEDGPRLRELALAHFELEANLDRLALLYQSLHPITPPTQLETQVALEFFSAVVREDRQLTKQRLHTLNSLAHSQQILLTEVDRIKSTVSWQITKPVRAFWNILRLLLPSDSAKR